MKTKSERSVQFNIIILLLLALFAAAFPGEATAKVSYYVTAQQGEWVEETLIYRLQGEASNMPLSTKFYATNETGTYLVPITELNFTCSTVCQWDAYLDLSGLNPGTYKLIVEMRLAPNYLKSDIYPHNTPPTPDCEGQEICVT